MSKKEKTKPSKDLPLGFFDRQEEELLIRDSVISTIKDIMVKYGFKYLETPSFEYSEGEFYNGDRVEVTLGAEWRPNRRLLLGLDYEYNDIKLPQSDFITRQIQVNANFSFNPRWSWLNLLQYDNESKSAGLNSRLRWNPRSGQDLYLSLIHISEPTRPY